MEDRHVQAGEGLRKSGSGQPRRDTESARGLGWLHRPSTTGEDAGHWRPARSSFLWRSRPGAQPHVCAQVCQCTPTCNLKPCLPPPRPQPQPTPLPPTPRGILEHKRKQAVLCSRVPHPHSKFQGTLNASWGPLAGTHWPPTCPGSGTRAVCCSFCPSASPCAGVRFHRGLAHATRCRPLGLVKGPSAPRLSVLAP